MYSIAAYTYSYLIRMCNCKSGIYKQNHVIEEKGFEHSDKQQEYTEYTLDESVLWLAGAGVGLGCIVVGLGTFLLAGFSQTQEQYDEATLMSMPLMIGGAALGVVSLVLYFAL